MKKCKALFVLALVFLAASSCAAAPVDKLEGIGVVSGEHVRVRAEPNTGADIQHQLDRGAKVEIMGRSEPAEGEKYPWYQVRYENTGWIYGQFLDVTENQGTVAAAPPAADKPVPTTAAPAAASAAGQTSTQQSSTPVVTVMPTPAPAPAAAAPAPAEAAKPKPSGPTLSAKEFVELCSRGTPAEIEAAIQNGANVNAKADADAKLVAKSGKEVDIKGETPLIAAVWLNDNPGAISTLLKAGADVNGKDADGYFPLVIAVSWDRLEIVSMLIEAGADVNAKNNKGRTALGFAVNAQNAGTDENTKLISVLIKAGADVNEKDEDGETLLMASVYYGKRFFMLLEAGADPNVKDKDGKTVLHKAVGLPRNEEKADRIAALIKAGTDVNAKDKDGYTALLSAVWARDANTVVALLEAGADVNAKDKDGMTVLMIWANSYNRDFTEKIFPILIKAGADVNAQSNKGTTALMVAEKFTPDLVPMLRKAGAKQ